ncbi:NAD(P)H-hydrate epimerase [Candidatus Laterigemmans baculatus]|uniref:NAD(P)H-hydrate epimerase n=1 Tax=Candidatus Laterigemmans baculatus TaxID=2770505 RepID=UPI0013DB8EB2|nr:NAD(P)H-hydrate epimerase [Candidatus Laterigemmans baculatus]
MDPIIARPLTREQVRRVDRVAIDEYGMSGLVLMENAGRGAAETIDRVAPAGAITILCGKGNNAGDGYVIARHLQLAGREVRVAQLFDPAQLSGDAEANWKIVEKGELVRRVLPAKADEADDGGDQAGDRWSSLRQWIDESATIVDAMLGTGASGQPREPLATAIRLANQSAAVRIAIDIPSGLDCDSGEPADTCFRAAHTCTFVAPKAGFANPASGPFVGTVHVLAIGVPRKLLEEVFV